MTERGNPDANLSTPFCRPHSGAFLHPQFSLDLKLSGREEFLAKKVSEGTSQQSSPFLRYTLGHSQS